MTDTDPDYVWIHPDTGEIRCWINNLPEPWSKAGNNDDIIGSGAGPADSVFLAVSCKLFPTSQRKANSVEGYER